MSKPWGNIGAWAAEAERAEEEERQAAVAAAADTQSFPSLREAVKEKSKRKKIPLSQFINDSPSGGGRLAGQATRLTPEETMCLPTGPRQHSADEVPFGRLGGGFSSYGAVRSGPPRSNRREDDGSWGGGGRRSYGGGFDDERRGNPPRVSPMDQPSRADEVDNWSMTKKQLPSFDSNNRQNRYGSLGGGRADEVDNWAFGKKSLAAPAARSSFGSGFRNLNNESDRWGRGGESFPEERGRPRLVLDPPKGNLAVDEPVKTNKANPFGAARPREEVLAEKGLDWKKIDSQLEAKRTSRPTSSQSSRPSSAQSSRSEVQPQQGVEVAVKPKPKVNPFGDAKPREVLLEQKGVDWRKIDSQLEHRRVDRPESEEEKKLKEEIGRLKELTKGSTVKGMESVQGPSEDKSSLQEIIQQKELELETLIRDLDNKVRFGTRTERPGSGSGRGGTFLERPRSSQSGSFDEVRNIEFMDRPHSRGRADVWTRPVEERRGFQGGRDRGFRGNRDFNGSTSRERW